MKYMGFCGIEMEIEYHVSKISVRMFFGLNI